MPSQMFECTKHLVQTINKPTRKHSTVIRFTIRIENAVNAIFLFAIVTLAQLPIQVELMASTIEWIVLLLKLIQISPVQRTTEEWQLWTRGMRTTRKIARTTSERKRIPVRVTCKQFGDNKKSLNCDEMHNAIQKTRQYVTVHMNNSLHSCTRTVHWMLQQNRKCYILIVYDNIARSTSHKELCLPNAAQNT